jgi:hypothetical protein
LSGRAVNGLKGPGCRACWLRSSVLKIAAADPGKHSSVRFMAMKPVRTRFCPCFCMKSASPAVAAFSPRRRWRWVALYRGTSAPGQWFCSFAGPVRRQTGSRSFFVTPQAVGAALAMSCAGVDGRVCSTSFGNVRILRSAHRSTSAAASAGEGGWPTVVWRSTDLRGWP